MMPHKPKSNPCMACKYRIVALGAVFCGNDRLEKQPTNLNALLAVKRCSGFSAEPPASEDTWERERTEFLRAENKQ